MDSSPLVEVERSPLGRYIRYDSKLGEGSCKKVYRAFDTEEGREVAWNATKNLTKFREHEVGILKTLKHPNILTLHDYWIDEQRGQTCFITDVMIFGTLHDFMSRIGKINIRVIKNWCRQILQALNYMHTLTPPVIHRDLKCDNIFIDSSTSQLRIGDFGLSAIKDQSYLSSMEGTPQFMAPEIFEEKYTEKVDIYAFGMCVLEMATQGYPYEECSNNCYQIYKNVMSGQKPRLLASVDDPELRQFIELCLLSEKKRPSAKELLDHPFLITTSLPKVESSNQLQSKEKLDEIIESNYDKVDEKQSKPLTETLFKPPMESQLQDKVKDIVEDRDKVEEKPKDVIDPKKEEARLLELKILSVWM